jgi:propionate CoA-transferase
MDAAHLRPGPMGYREEWLSLPLESRLTYDPAEGVFFINFEGFGIRRREDIERVRQAVEERLAPLGRKVPAIVNYDHFTIVPELLDAYTDMVGAWCGGSTPASPATRPAPSSHEARRRAAPARRGAAHLRGPRGGRGPPARPGARDGGGEP